MTAALQKTGPVCCEKNTTAIGHVCADCECKNRELTEAVYGTTRREQVHEFGALQEYMRLGHNKVYHTLAGSSRTGQTHHVKLFIHTGKAMVNITMEVAAVLYLEYSAQHQSLTYVLPPGGNVGKHLVRRLGAILKLRLSQQRM